MNLAFKNEQEQSDTNLWKWPATTYDPGWVGDAQTHISIKPWLWMRWSDGLGGSGANQLIRNITDKSIEILYSGSYKACVFIDLSVGSYSLKFSISDSINFRITKYVKCDDEKYVYANTSSTYFDAGTHQLNFSVEDGMFTRLDFGNNLGREYVKLSDVEIKEL